MLFASFAFALGTLFSSVDSYTIVNRNVQSCQTITAPSIPGATVVSITKKEHQDYTVPAVPLLNIPEVSGLNICEVNVTLTHPGVNDKVLVQVWLPLKNWNNRFVAVGGSGWAAGLGGPTLAPAVAQGFAATSTDAGLSGDPATPALWALKENGEVNTGLLTNFASRSIHDMAIVGKVVTAQYYGTPAKYSYWNGCSTGGRQGLVAAQKYPEDFDGILAGAPAIYWANYVVAEQWPQVVMKEENYLPSPCELAGVTNAAIAACDALDGVKDGIITELAKCKFDPFTTVGKKIQCDGKEITISHPVASIVRKIWDGGPRTRSGNPEWYGLTVGAPLDSLANTVAVNGTRIPQPFFVNDAWIRYFLKRDPKFNTSSVSSADLTDLFTESVSKYSDLIGSANPDLSGLKKSGGRLLVWHGEADQLIFPQGTKRYRQQVEKVMGPTSKVDEFFRLFLAPGVDHCGQGSTPGAAPSDAFGALISWVENGTAPDVLSAATAATASSQFTRKICRYPLVSVYNGSGDPNAAGSYNCELPSRKGRHH